MRKRAVRAVAVVSLVVAAMVVAPMTAALAHDEPVSYSPTDGSVVSVDPGRVAVTFEEPPGNGPSSLTVTDHSGRTAVTGDVSIDGSVMSAPIRLVRAGSYEVRFEIVSDDGHPVTGAFGFTFRPGPIPARNEAAFVASGHPSAQPPALGWFPWSALGILLTSCVMAWRARRRLERLTTVGN